MHPWQGLAACWDGGGGRAPQHRAARDGAAPQLGSPAAQFSGCSRLLSPAAARAARWGPVQGLNGCCGGVRAGWVCAAQPGPSLLVSDAGAVALVQGE